jgi:hypothetical protein
MRGRSRILDPVGDDMTRIDEAYTEIYEDVNGDGEVKKTAMTSPADLNRRTTKKHSRTVTIGTAKFSIVADKTTTVKVKLNAAGRGLLNVDRGRLTASLEILEPMPGPTYNETANVHLAQQTYRGKAKK